MADNELTLRISAKTDEFIKSVEDAKTKVRSLSMQMAEIDKQLKTESVDRVKKLADKLDLAKRASEAAAKEAELYGTQIKKLTDKNENLNNLTDRQKEKLLKLSEQMATAQQKANTYAAEVNKLEKEYKENATAAESAGGATKDLAESLSDASKETEKLSQKTEEGEKNTGRFFDRLKEGVAVNLISSGLEKIGSFFANIAAKAWDAAKAFASFAKDYAKNAVELAAGYQDQVGYAGEVFKDYKDKAIKWVEEMSLPLRVSENELLEYLNKLGNIHTAFGYSTEEAAKKSQELIQLAVDLRAATGDDLAQTMGALTSALTGQYKPLQRYGVVINEARIQATALANNLVTVETNQLEVEKATIKVTEANKKAAKELQLHGEESIEYQKAQIAVTEAEEALNKALDGKALSLTQVQKQEALAIIYEEDLANVEGQAAREADSYSSQLALRATLLENLQKKIGQKLLPVFNEFVTKVNEFMTSDAGKAVMDALAESVGILADKVMELLQDERLTEWIGNLKDEIPQVTEKVIGFAEKIGDLIPKVLDLTEKVVDFFDKSQKTKDAKQAYAECQQELHKFAEESNIDFNDLIKTIKAYSEETDTDLAKIYEQWGIYKPEIIKYMDELCTNADGTRTDLKTAMEGMVSDTQNAVTNIGNTDTSGLEGLRARVRSWADGIATAVSEAWNWLKKAESENSFIDSNGNERQYGRASGGPVRAGQMYRVNDDHGRRVETFIPAVNGYILNGQDTQRVINNSTNNSRTYGDVNVYVNSYGTDAATIAEEIGAEVNRKLRMAGAW